jgi:hypothetical protein
MKPSELLLMMGASSPLRSPTRLSRPKDSPRDRVLNKNIKKKEMINDNSK